MKSYYLLLAVLCFYSASFSQGVDKPRYRIETHRAGVFLGNIDVELFPSIAPQHVNNFDSLVNIQFLDSTAFHRVVPGFVIQGGDPNSINGPISTWGYGQPWQATVPAEFSVARHYRGRIGAARDLDTNSATSQFYISVANTFSLDGQYTVYGQVTEGLNIVDTIVSSPRDVNDVPLQKIEMFVTYIGVNDTIPADPVLTNPADQSVNVPGGVAFQWNNVSDAVIYYLQVATDSTFNTVQIAKMTGVNSGTVAGLLPNTTYFWRVKSDNGGHQSNWSLPFKFTTGSPAQLIYPANNAVNVTLNTLFQWSAVPNITSYNLQIDTDTLFLLPYTGNYLGITTNSKQVNNLPANTQLYWRVRYFNGSVSGFFSEKFGFTTGSTVSVDELVAGSASYIKNIYPVPATTQLTLEVASVTNEIVSLQLNDITGKTIVSRSNFQLPEDGKITVDLSGVAKGAYIIKVVTADMEESRLIEVK